MAYSLDQPLNRPLGEKIRDLCLQPDGEHSVLSSGRHGQKLEVDKLKDGTPLYKELIKASADKIERIARGVPLGEIALIGVARGGNRFVTPIAERLGGGIMPLFTKKSEDNKVHLTPDAIHVISHEQPTLALFIDDIGNTGGTVVSPVIHAKELGAKQSKVVYAASRKIILSALEVSGIDYYSVEDILLPDFTPEECTTDSEGLCALGWKLV